MKTKLAEAMKSLMVKKPFEKITVKEITDMCGVNRQTFYYHFEDIYDLLKWWYREELDSLFLVQQEQANSWQEAIYILLSYLSENREVCKCVLNSLGHRNLKRFVYGDIYTVVGQYIDVLGDYKDEDEDFREFIMHFYTLALGTLMENWVMGEIDKTPQQLIEYLEKFFRKNR